MKLPEGGSFVSLLTLYLFYFFEIMIDEEINVLFIGLVHLRTFEVRTFDVFNAPVITFSTLKHQTVLFKHKQTNKI